MNLVYNLRAQLFGSGGVKKWSHEVFQAVSFNSLVLNQEVSLNGIKPNSLKFSKGAKAYLWEQFVIPRMLEKNSILLSPGNTGPISVSRQVIVIHDVLPFTLPNEYSWQYRNALRIIYGSLLSRVDMILTVSNQQKTEIAKLFGVPHTKIFNVGVGVKFSNIKPLSSENKFGNYYLMVGYSISRKNAQFLLGIWDSIFKDSGVRLVLTGRSEHSSSYLPSPRQFSLAGVNYINDPTDYQLSQLYSNMIGLLHPSIGEGFGIPLLEAMSHGKSFISSDVGAAAELKIGNSRVLPLDEDLWIRAIKDHYRQVPAKDELQIESAKKHSWDNVAERILTVLSTHFNTVQ